MIADSSASPELVAADLIAQAEHDVEALPILLSTELDLVRSVDEAIDHQMRSLGTAGVAGPALRNGFAVIVEDLSRAAEVSNSIAPEHLALHSARPEEVSQHLQNYGSMFRGGSSAETFADYGIGPNHVLPTGGSARFQSGLSPMTFLKAATWLELHDATQVLSDTVELARHEGLEGHARAAEARIDPSVAAGTPPGSS